MSQKALEQLVKNWQNNLFENSEVLTKLKNLRNINHLDKLRDLELGLAEVPGEDTLPPKLLKSLKSFGLLNEKITGMVSIPLRKAMAPDSYFTYSSIMSLKLRIIDNLLFVLSGHSSPWFLF